MSERALTDSKKLARALYFAQQRAVAPFVLPVSLVAMRLMGLGGEAGLWALLVPLPVVSLVFVVLLPYLAFQRETARAFEARGAQRVELLLKLGPRLELIGLGSYLSASFLFNLVLILRHDLSWWVMPVVLAFIVAYERVAVLMQSVSVESRLMPHLLEAQALSGESLPAPSGNVLLNPSIGVRLRTLVLASGMAVLMTVLALYLSSVRDVLGQLALEGADSGVIAAELLPRAWRQGWLELVGVSGFIIVLAAWATRMQAARIRTRLNEGARLVEALAEGHPKTPSWIASDETGMLSSSLFSATATTRGAASRLRLATNSLSAASSELAHTSEEELRSVQATMVALRETEVTAQEIRQTSLLALEKTQVITTAIAEAETAAERGREAIALNARGLEQIAGAVSDTAARTRALSDWARKIDGIARSVKEIATQSNVLALNAGIEAVRAGAEGRSFGIVAREIRSLAAQSLTAANEVRALVEQVNFAIDLVAEQGETSLEIVEQARQQAAESQERLEALTLAVQGNAAAVRQVIEAVSQQSAGIGQIFEALRELAVQADGSALRVERSTDASERLKQAGSEVERALRALDRDAA